MPEIRSLTRPKPVEVPIDIGDGDTVTVVFDRNRVAPAWVASASERDRDEDRLSLAKALAEVILDWDVTDDGAPFPPTFANIAVFSFPAQQALIRSILEAAVPGAAEGNDSASTSSSAATASTSEPATLPNGEEPSQSHPLSASLSTR